MRKAPIRWGNLINQFWLAPGTRRVRILLSLWQVWLMVASGLGAMCAGWWGLLVGFVVAWTSHELFFMWYAESVVGVREPDRYPYETVMQMGSHPVYVPTIERYWGPFGSDPHNEQTG